MKRGRISHSPSNHIVDYRHTAVLESWIKHLNSGILEETPKSEKKKRKKDRLVEKMSEAGLIIKSRLCRLKKKKKKDDWRVAGSKF